MHTKVFLILAQLDTSLGINDPSNYKASIKKSVYQEISFFSQSSTRKVQLFGDFKADKVLYHGSRYLVKMLKDFAIVPLANRQLLFGSLKTLVFNSNC